MARIRSIKPEFCTSEQITECSPNARLLFVLMWMFCDDNGIHPRSPKRLKMECFPADDFTSADIEGMLVELIDAGLLREYEVDGQGFVQVTGWHKHQKIDQPTPKHPLPDGSIPTKTRRKAGEQTQNDTRVSGEHSANVRREVGERSPPEGKGVEGKGEEGDSEPNGSGAAAPLGLEGLGENVHPLRAVVQATPEKGVPLDKQVYDRGKALLGPNAGGVVTKLRAKYGRDDMRVLNLLELAAQKENPTEYIGAVLRGDRSATDDEEIAELRREQARRFGGRSV